MRKGVHISIEGMDGVGKTTLSKLLAEKLGYDFIEKPLQKIFSNYIEMRDIVNGMEDRIFTAWFYGLCNISLYTLYGNQNIITDRHILSNFFWSGTEYNEDIYLKLIDQIGLPNHTFILYADENTLTKRLLLRDPADEDIAKVPMAEQNYTKLIIFANKYKLPHIVIDTNSKDSSQILDEVLGYL